jgi:Ca2+-binding RTX toxin-like protein
MLMATMTLAVLAFGGVAWALTFTCTSGDCFGTPQDDHIIGNEFSQFFNAKAGDDIVEGRGGNDTIEGRSGADRLVGDGNDPSDDGQDFLNGAGGPDILTGEAARDTYLGGSGPDTIRADFIEANVSVVDDISAGGGNDTIQADDGSVDVVDCGAGSDDRANVDQGGPGDDIVRNCETEN